MKNRWQKWFVLGCMNGIFVAVAFQSILLGIMFFSGKSTLPAGEMKAFHISLAVAGALFVLLIFATVLQRKDAKRAPL